MDRMLKKTFWALCVLGAGFLSAGVYDVSANVGSTAEEKAAVRSPDSPGTASSAQATPFAPAAPVALAVEENEFLNVKDIFALGFPVKETIVPKVPSAVASPS